MAHISEPQPSDCITYTFYEKIRPKHSFTVGPSEWKVARISKGLDEPIPNFQWASRQIPHHLTQEIVRHLKQKALNMRLVCKFFSHSSFNDIYRKTPFSKAGNPFQKSTRGFLFFIRQFPSVKMTNPKIHGEKLRPIALPEIREKFPNLTSLKSIVITDLDELQEFLDQHHDFLPVIRSLAFILSFAFPGISIDLIHQAIRALSNLAHLHFNGNNLQGLFSGFELNSLPKLRSVTFEHTDVPSDTVIKLFEIAPHLKYIILQENKNVDINEIQTYLLTNNPFPGPPHIVFSKQLGLTNAERSKLPKDQLTILYN